MPLYALVFCALFLLFLVVIKGSPIKKLFFAAGIAAAADLIFLIAAERVAMLPIGNWDAP